MTKQELIKVVTSKIDGGTQKNTAVVLDCILETIKEELLNEGKVFIVGFGTFEVSERPERMGRNPQTNEPMLLKASKTPKFKASGVFKDELNTQGR